MRSGELGQGATYGSDAATLESFYGVNGSAPTKQVGSKRGGLTFSHFLHTIVAQPVVV